MSALTFRERPADGDAAGLLVLHHGRGADEQDLLSLGDVLDPAAPSARRHAARAAAARRLAGYHWYVVPRVGYPDHDTFHAGVPGARRLPRRAVGAHGADRGADRVRRLLDGLGDVVRARARRRIVRRPRASWRSRASSRSSTAGSPPVAQRTAVPVFIAHGRRDPIMEVGFAQRARELLEGGGLRSSTTSPTRRTTSIPRTCPRRSSGSQARFPA
jgi:phospholipase/carboxylesterase